MITSAIPVIAVSDSARAEEYYCQVLGFQKMFAYPPDATRPDPRYIGVVRDGVWLHLQSYKPERAGMTDAFLWVVDVDRLHDELSARGAMVQLPPTNQTWGTRETGIRDPDGNVLVFATKPANPNGAKVTPTGDRYRPEREVTPKFLETLGLWIDSNSEVFVVLRYLRAAGAKDYAFIKTRSEFALLVEPLPNGTDIIVFRDPQLPLRGKVTGEFIEQAKDQVKDGDEYMLVRMTPRRQETSDYSERWGIPTQQLPRT